MHPDPVRLPLRRFFAGITESAFLARIGLADPPLVDYISDLLVRFVHFDSVHQIRSLSGRQLVQVTDMVREAEKRLGPARRDAYRHTHGRDERLPLSFGEELERDEQNGSQRVRVSSPPGAPSLISI